MLKKLASLALAVMFIAGTSIVPVFAGQGPKDWSNPKTCHYPDCTPRGGGASGATDG